MAIRQEREAEPAAPPATAAGDGETKEQLQRRMDEARESIAQTVGEIKGTVEDQYATVKATVSGILDWREKFQSEPIVWSVGALAAGFALGHTLGSAQKRKRPSGKPSPVAVFADTLADTLKEEFAAIGKTLPMSSIDASIKKVLGFELSDLFAEIGGAKGSAKSKRAEKRSSARSKVSRGRQASGAQPPRSRSRGRRTSGRPR